MDYSTVENEIGWVLKAIHLRSRPYYKVGKDFSKEPDTWLIDVLPPLGNSLSGPLGDFITRHGLSEEERFLVGLCLLAHLKPSHFATYSDFGAGGNRAFFDQLNLVRGGSFSGFLATGLTYVFLMGGNNFSNRIRAAKVLSVSNKLSKLDVIGMSAHRLGEPALSGLLYLDEAFLEKVLFDLDAPDPQSVKYKFLNHENAKKST